jgi:hypothetical protein
LKATPKVLAGLIRRWLHEQLRVVGNNRRVLFEAVFARPVRIGGEKHQAAALGSKLAEETENQCYVSEMVHLKGLLVAVTGNFHIARLVPVISVANNAGERREGSACNFSGNSAGESVHG